MTALTVSGRPASVTMRGEGALLLPGALVVAEPVVGLLVRALERQLRVIEAGVDELGPELLAHPDARGDEVGVEAGLDRARA